MDTPKVTKRKNFRCVFNRYVTKENQDAVVRSIISQFEGYYADPEVTLTDDGFIISLTIGENLSPTSVRDKILWNQFVESVTAADAIRKIQIIRLPKSSKENEGSVGAFGPHGSDSGVDEKLNIHLDQNPQYTIGPNEDGSLGWHASVHYAHDDLHPWPITHNEAIEHIISHHSDAINFVKDSLGKTFSEMAHELRSNWSRGDHVHAQLHKDPLIIEKLKLSHEHDEEQLDIDIPDTVETIMPTTIGVGASVHYADPTGNMLPTIYGPGAEDGEPVDEDVLSDATDMKSTSKPKLFMGFKVIAVDSDTGGAFTLNKPNGFQSVLDAPDQGPLHERAVPATGIGGGAPISGASWYVTQPGNEQGTQLGVERNRGDASSAPFGNISIGSVESPALDEENPQQGIKGHYGDTLDVLGVGEHPMGGAAYGSYFGLNEYYDYEGEIDDNYL